MKIQIAKNDDALKWNKFCKDNSVPFGHYFEWMEYYKSIGFLNLPLMALGDSNRVIGICLLNISKKFNGFYQAFSPFASLDTYGGPIVTDNSAIRPLINAVDNYLEKLSVAVATIRIRKSISLINDYRDALNYSNYTNVSEHVDDDYLWSVFRINLTDFKQQKRQISSRNLRYYRKALKEGVVIEEVNKAEFIRDFLPIQKNLYKKLGNHCHNDDFIKKMLSADNVHYKLYLSKYKKICLGGLSCIYAGNGCFSKHIASDESYQELRINNALFLHALEDACDSNAKFFCMGLTAPKKQSGHYNWKIRYGGSSDPIIKYEKINNRRKFFFNRIIVKMTNKIVKKYSYDSSIIGKYFSKLDYWRKL